MLPNPSTFRIREFNAEETESILPELAPELIRERIDYNVSHDGPICQFVVHVRHIRTFDQLVTTIRAGKGMQVDFLELEEITV